MNLNNNSSFLPPSNSSNLFERKIIPTTIDDTIMTSNTLKIAQSMGYTLSGFSAIVSSFIVIITVLRHKSLHTKDFYILAGLSGADLLRGYGYFHGGIFRTWLIVQQTEAVLITPTDCMLQIYQTFMIFGQKASPLVIMMLSVDRLLAVVLFHRYKLLGTLYALGVISCAYAVSAFVTAFAWITALFCMPSGLRVPETCKTEAVTPNLYFCIEISFRFFPGFISSFVYLAALFAVRSKATGMLENDHKRQKQLTKNVAIIMLVEFAFSTLPFGYMLYSFVFRHDKSDLFDTLSPFVWSLSLLGAAGNLFLYALKYPKFRIALLNKRGVAPSRMVGSRQDLRPGSTSRY